MDSTISSSNKSPQSYAGRVIPKPASRGAIKPDNVFCVDGPVDTARIFPRVGALENIKLAAKRPKATNLIWKLQTAELGKKKRSNKVKGKINMGNSSRTHRP